jgi:hypothetical protein
MPETYLSNMRIQQFQRLEQKTFEGAFLIKKLVKGEDNLSTEEEKEEAHNNHKFSWILHK